MTVDPQRTSGAEMGRDCQGNLEMTYSIDKVFNTGLPCIFFPQVLQGWSKAGGNGFGFSDLEETIAARLDLCSTERLYLPDLRFGVVAGPRACHRDQTKSGQPYQFDIFGRTISPCQDAFVKGLSTSTL